MEPRFRVRLDELLNDAELPPGLLRGLLPPPERFPGPFVAPRQRHQPRTHARPDVPGLLSDLDDQTAAASASFHDRDRQGLQKFLGQSPWDHRPLLTELVRQVGRELGDTEGVLVFDPSAVPKQGTESVGVRRPWCGR